MTDKYISGGNKQNRLAGITLMYFLGVLTGVILYSFPLNGQAVQLNQGAENYIMGRFNKEFAEIMINSFCEPFIMIMVCFILGLSAIAQPAEYLVPVFHGFGTGITLAGIYDRYGINGIGMAAVMIIPGTVISAFAVIIAAREAVSMSSEIGSSVFGKNGVGVKIDFRLYFTKYVILCAMSVAGAFIESVLIFFLSEIWQI